jgi:hypothetical protein
VTSLTSFTNSSIFQKFHDLLLVLNAPSSSFRSKQPAGIATKHCSGVIQWPQHNSKLEWTLQIRGREGEDREPIAHTERESSLYILSDVILLRLGCRSNACGFRRVLALLVFYSSFATQNTVYCKSQCVKLPPILSRLRGRKNVFSYSRLFAIKNMSLTSCSPLRFSVTQLKLAVMLRPLYWCLLFS